MAVQERDAVKYENRTPRYQAPFIGKRSFWVSGCGAIDDFPPHWHGEVELIYLLSGSGSLAVTIDGREFLLKAGDVVLIAGAQVHSGRIVDPDAEIAVIEMGFSLLGEDFFPLIGRQFEGTVVNLWKPELPETLRGLRKILDQIVEERRKETDLMEEWSTAGRLRMTSLLFALAAGLVEHQTMPKTVSRQNGHPEAMMAVQGVLAYLEQAYPEPITLEKAAGMAGYEKTRFCQLFKKAVGISFHKYLTDKRIRAAACLLQGTDLPIGQVGETVGINQSKTFSRLIRETYGITPKQLREQKRENETIKIIR